MRNASKVSAELTCRLLLPHVGRCHPFPDKTMPQHLGKIWFSFMWGPHSL